MKARLSHLFRPVGQGLFAQGKVKDYGSGRECLHWIHDCGSSDSPDALAREVRRARAMIAKNGNRLDLLILSHFDQDHVNGLRDLLTGIYVETVVMPYMAPADRLLFAFGDPSVASLGDYVEFLISPTAYLQSVTEAIGQVIYVEANDEDEGNDFPADEPDFDPDRRRDFPDRVSKWESVVLGEHELSDVDSQTGVRERRFRGQGEIEYAGLWEFKFFNRAAWRGVLPKLRAEVQNELDKFYAQPISDQDYGVLIETLRALYRDPAQFGDGENGRNEISLITYSGPVGHTEIFKVGCRSYDANISPMYGAGLGFSGANYGILYTGDIIMRPALRSELQRRLGLSRWNNLGTFQVPHHGADTAWKDVPPDVWRHRWSIFSYGSTNTYGHPGSASEAAMSGHGPVRVNEFVGFFWFYGIIW